ncbi:POTRA domain-containing protein [Niabella insulamsoli]|uniref:POTRA domain-containing protein n=1 Tax=Niabella insulamsoli TaxID=3144874 RepID=UPI0031FD5BE3
MKATKIRYLITALLLLSAWTGAAQQHYTLSIIPVDGDSIAVNSIVPLRQQFVNRSECNAYVDQLLPQLQAKGYISASIDTIRLDSTFATLHLFLGDRYRWGSVLADEQARSWFNKIGWSAQSMAQQQYDPERLARAQERMLAYLENNGHPFAKIYLDSITINGGEVAGKLHVNPGPLYHIDSIKVTGNAKITNAYLQQFLDLKKGAIYNKEKLQRISDELRKLSYVEETFPPQIVFSSSGGVIELFLNQKKSSQVNVIIGFQPNSDASATKKMLITGEALLDLKNAFGGGESIGLIWQRMQASSQRLNLSYNQPYLFNSPFGVDLSFNMLKRDSAFLNLDFKIGGQLSINRQQNIQLYLQRFSSVLSFIDEASIIASRRLPAEADVKITHIGIEYQLNSTNYRFNPVSGFEIRLNTAAGNKNVRPNNQIVDLVDPDDPDFDFARLYDTVTTKSYQLRSELMAAKYFPLGKAQRNTIKTALNGGYISGSNIFRNELFQIGGYRLLRGFDEQSQFLSQYAIGTLEYRYLIGANSYFNAFTDGGWGKDGSRGNQFNYSYLAAGLGLSFETKVGLFNLAWAVGKRNDTNFNLRQSKIHFAFVNYF